MASLLTHVLVVAMTVVVVGLLVDVVAHEVDGAVTKK